MTNGIRQRVHMAIYISRRDFNTGISFLDIDLFQGLSLRGAPPRGAWRFSRRSTRRSIAFRRSSCSVEPWGAPPRTLSRINQAKSETRSMPFAGIRLYLTGRTFRSPLCSVKVGAGPATKIRGPA
jgi:hypothetical protein